MPLLSPLTLLVFGLLLSGLSLLRPARRLLVAGVGCVLVALVAMTPFAANALVGAIERGAEVEAAQCADLQAVVFLSGGVDRPPVGEGDLSALTSDSVSRVFGLVRRGTHGKLPLVVSGGGPHSVAESDVIAGLMRSLGVDAERVVLESASRTTFDSAFAVADRFPRVQRIALATSALHLPRAMLVFRAAGFEVCPWPLSARWQDARGPWALLPQSSSLRKSEAALYELAGMAWYRWRLLSRQPSS